MRPLRPTPPFKSLNNKYKDTTNPSRESCLELEREGFVVSLYAWRDAFETFEWEEAVSDPGVAMREIGRLVALV